MQLFSHACPEETRHPFIIAIVGTDCGLDCSDALSVNNINDTLTFS